MLPPCGGLLESALYVTNVDASASFYQRIFGFTKIDDFGERGCALAAGPTQVLLLFKKGASARIRPSHDGYGEIHLAFKICAGDLARWKSWLAENGVAVEETRDWPRGGQSVYFRDPDRHLVEVATPGVWTIY